MLEDEDGAGIPYGGIIMPIMGGIIIGCIPFIMGGIPIIWGIIIGGIPFIMGIIGNGGMTGRFELLTLGERPLF